MFRKANTLFIIISIIISSYVQALACTCRHPRPNIEESIQISNFIFIGKCITGGPIYKGLIKALNPAHAGPGRYLLEVQKRIKGKYKPNKIQVETDEFCNLDFILQHGVSYLIYGNIQNNLLRVNKCDRIKVVGFYPIKIDEHVKGELETLNIFFDNTHR